MYQRCACVRARVCEAFAFEEFFLEAGEECLGERVVPGVADAAHGEIDSRLLGMAAVGQARILGAVIGCAMTPARLARVGCHVERVEDELCFEVVAH